VIESSLSPESIIAFVTLTLAVALLWAPVVLVNAPRILVRWMRTRPEHAWITPGAVSLLFALIGGLIDFRGLIVLLSFAAACIAANRARVRGAGLLPTLVTHAIMLAIGAGLFLHVMPGIDNPRVVTDAVLGPGAAAYSKYLNFDKGIAGLCLLGLYAPHLPSGDEGARHVPGILWRFAIVVAVVMALSLALGYVRWDPKLPAWWPLWMWSMVVLTALPEEAVFRGLAQTWIAKRFEDGATLIPMTLAGLLFGLAHLAGGPAYVLLASAAGIGYGWVFASTRSIGAAIATHVGVNAIHFFLFTYPLLAPALAR
jgi:membrane protease YdiL (CAAX protease family)